MATLTEEDEGKILVDGEGEELGIVTEVDSGTAWVDPDPSIGEAALATFGWAEADVQDYTVDADLVETVTDQEVRLGEDV